MTTDTPIPATPTTAASSSDPADSAGPASSSDPADAAGPAFPATSRVLVIQSVSGGGPGRFGDRLIAHGLRLEVVKGYEGAEPPPVAPESYAALMVLGGNFMPDDDTNAPWLAGTRAWASAALERGLPYFGMCLGGQLLAYVAGGTVAAQHGTPEVGSTPLTLRPEAAADPLFRDLPPTVTAIERHVDAITGLPPGASWLASSAACPYQAFRVGERAWGVQFHPEVEADRVRRWDPEKLRRRGVDPVEVADRAARDEVTAGPIWRTVADRFATLVTTSAVTA